MRRVALLAGVVLVAAACGGAGADADADVDADADEVAPTTVTTIFESQGGDTIMAEEGDVVAVHYVGTLDDGTEFDSSRSSGATLDFEIGSGNMIAGFDQGVRGMAEGEVKTVRIEPADAYGEVNPDFVIEVELSQVPEGTRAGDVLADPSTGAPVAVVSIEGEVVTLDLNHRLAGEALTFEIEMVSITR